MYSSLMAIFFRILNSLILLVAGYYIYKYYIKAQTDEKITQQEALIKGLEEQGYFLEGKAHALAQKLKEHDANVQRLQHKIEEWRHAVAAKEYKDIHEHEMRATMRMQRTLMKNTVIADRYLKAQIVPEVITLLQQQLEKKFSTATDSQAYVSMVIRSLQKES